MTFGLAKGSRDALCSERIGNRGNTKKVSSKKKYKEKTASAHSDANRKKSKNKKYRNAEKAITSTPSMGGKEGSAASDKSQGKDLWGGHRGCQASSTSLPGDLRESSPQKEKMTSRRGILRRKIPLKSEQASTRQRGAWYTLWRDLYRGGEKECSPRESLH